LFVVFLFFSCGLDIFLHAPSFLQKDISKSHDSLRQERTAANRTAYNVYGKGDRRSGFNWGKQQNRKKKPEKKNNMKYSSEGAFQNECQLIFK
jgi:hypothetical protein